MFFTFLREKTLLQSEEVFSRWMSAKHLAKTRGRCKLPAPLTGRNFGAKLAHFYGVTKRRSRFWSDVSLLSRVENIVRSADCLELSCVWKLRCSFSVSISQVRILKNIYSPQWNIGKGSINTQYSTIQVNDLMGITFVSLWLWWRIAGGNLKAGNQNR